MRTHVANACFYRLSDVKVTTTATPAFYSELQVQPEIDDWNFDMSENIMNDS